MRLGPPGHINDVTCVVSNGKIIIYTDDMAKEFKYLGVTFSSDASWTSHINTNLPKNKRTCSVLRIYV